MTETHPDRDVPQVDFDVHTGEPRVDQVGASDTDNTTDNDTDSEQEQP